MRSKSNVGGGLSGRFDRFFCGGNGFCSMHRLFFVSVGVSTLRASGVIPPTVQSLWESFPLDAAWVWMLSCASGVIALRMSLFRHAGIDMWGRRLQASPFLGFLIVRA